jgi:hypothetical protein
MRLTAPGGAIVGMLVWTAYNRPKSTEKIARPKTSEERKVRISEERGYGKR